MLAKQNLDIEDAVVTLHELSDDEQIKLQCEARERYERDMASAVAKGKREGEEMGLQKGLQKGEERSFLLVQKLAEDGLTDLITEISTDPALRKELYQKYNI